MNQKDLKQSDFPFQGFGLGLRSVHYEDILERGAKVDWFEVISENFMGLSHEFSEAPGINTLETIRKDYPIACHGVSLSIGSLDPLNPNYLKKLKMLVDRIDPLWVSDHLCWTGVHGKNAHDLLPLPYTRETIDHVANKIDQVQEFLGRRIMIENVSSYVEFKESEMTEWEFVHEVIEKADCAMLLDLNNIFVSSFNHGFDSYDYLKKVPFHRVGQIHLAGPTRHETHMVDTHDHPVTDEVWKLYTWVMENHEPISTMVEWDENIPPLGELEKEIHKAKGIYERLS